MYRSGLTELEVVLAVAKRRGFRAAATDLNMSTTAVSNAVAGLEARLGTRLFHRTTRSVSLTEAGQRFIEQIEPAVADIQQAMQNLHEDPARPTGTLRINSSLGAALMVFQPILLKFLNRYPGMTVDIVTEGKMVDIIAEGFDAGLRQGTRVPRDMIRVPITPNIQRVVVGSTDYFSTHPEPDAPEDLADHACIRARLPGGESSPWAFIRDEQTFTLDVLGPLVLDAPQLMVEAVRQGVGLAQVPQWYVQEDLEEGRLIQVLAPFTPDAPGLSLYYAGHRHIPPGLRSLIDLIHEQAGHFSF
ncbi:LysR family transcriptional regulator [Pseudomonas sp. C1C7]|uniref:LysR family transcriptional regulator n=1 Tax=Pseudomonas sp. C1C7 TaxID=2735272 RepID=UPI001586DE30|nr:LysR family transcriptional regulator [Pseudomonas sp. C1C7]NUT77401.1 LysR family transcriptional regulator [Pseudomonas sp. C1C7]